MTRRDTTIKRTPIDKGKSGAVAISLATDADTLQNEDVEERVVTFDSPDAGSFSKVYVRDEDRNVASVNAGDYRLYVGGGSILTEWGHNPKGKYEALHGRLLAKASMSPG